MTPEAVPEGPILVDTDVATWLLAEAEEAVRWRPLLRGHLLVLSFANTGELLALPMSRNWQARRTQAWADAIRTQFVVLPYSADVAQRWAPLHAKLRGHLHKGGANDLWVAACALAAEPSLPVATNSLADFQHIADETSLHRVHPDIAVPSAGDVVPALPLR